MLNPRTNQEDWRDVEEETDSLMVPRRFLVWWLALPLWAAIASGLCWVEPPGFGWPVATGLGVLGFTWGQLLRSQSRPPLVQFWIAIIGMILAFCWLLVLAVDIDSVLAMVVWSLSGSVVAWLLVMTPRFTGAAESSPQD